MNTSLLQPIQWIFDQLLQRELWTFDLRLTDLAQAVEVDLFAMPDSFAEEKFSAIGVKDVHEFSQLMLEKLGFDRIEPEAWDEGWWCAVLSIQWQAPKTSANGRAGKRNRAWFWLGYDEQGEAYEYKYLWTECRSSACAKQMMAAELMVEGLMTEAERAALDDIQDILAAVVEYLGKRAVDFALWTHASHWQKPADEQDYLHLLSLLNPNTATTHLQAAAERLHQRLSVEQGMNEGDLAEDLLFENCFHHDWKFDASELSEVLQDLTAEPELLIDAPADTFGEDLFEYAQAALQGLGLRLMNYQNLGDSYHFFVVAETQVAPILALSERLGCGLEVL